MHNRKQQSHLTVGLLRAFPPVNCTTIFAEVIRMARQGQKRRRITTIAPSVEGRDCAIFFDGACEPRNPGGVSTYGYILDWGGGFVDEGCGFICEGEGSTNNVAEWGALEAALTHLRDRGFCGSIEIYGDSALVIYQLTRRWACRKPHLEKSRDRCLALLNVVAEQWRAGWIPREENAAADKLSKRAYAERLDAKSRLIVRGL